jgi:PKD repeat protein
VNDSLETWNIGRWDPQAGFNYSIDEASVDFNQTSLYSTSNLWNFGDGNTSPLVNPTHTYNAPGNYTVSLIVNGCGRLDTLTEPISITATAIAENVKDINWRIFPNPSTRDVMIQAEDVTTFKIEVYGPDGKLAKRKSETGRLIKLDFSDLPAGIYQVYCYGNGSSRIFRLMKE